MLLKCPSHIAKHLRPKYVYFSRSFNCCEGLILWKYEFQWKYENVDENFISPPLDRCQAPIWSPGATFSYHTLTNILNINVSFTFWRWRCAIDPGWSKKQMMMIKIAQNCKHQSGRFGNMRLVEYLSVFPQQRCSHFVLSENK